MILGDFSIDLVDFFGRGVSGAGVLSSVVLALNIFVEIERFFFILRNDVKFTKIRQNHIYK